MYIPGLHNFRNLYVMLFLQAVGMPQLVWNMDVTTFNNKCYTIIIPPRSHPQNITQQPMGVTYLIAWTPYHVAILAKDVTILICFICTMCHF